ncbi:MAG TPA: hypothetical protein VG738_19905 [Chitinophagaceae bacterium]|nr:hypothetical protein [Chitinophagaceae bacterium]
MKYSVTTYFTSFDSDHVSPRNLGKKFIYSYEKYNADSNLILQNQYASLTDNEDEWGKLIKVTRFFYNGKQKLKAEMEGGMPRKKDDGWSNKYKEVDTYVYTGGQLTRWLKDGKPREEYKYNDQKEMIEKRVYLFSSDSSKFAGIHYAYAGGLKIKAQYFPVDTLYTSVDTFIYKNNKLVEEDSYKSNGEQTRHVVMIRDKKGRVTEEKWKDPILDWRKNVDGKWVNAEFNQENKYFYNSGGHPLKTEYYRSDEYCRSYQLVAVYEFKYD